MPLKHLRVCERCDLIRYAACSPGCVLPPDYCAESWRLNLQAGAGTIPVTPQTPRTPTITPRPDR